MREGTVGADTLEKRAERNIILCGFMGCGKSSIGRRLARLAGRSFVDMDEYIEKKPEKLSRKSLQRKARKPSDRWRKDAASALSRERGLVIASGGGTVLREKSRDALAETGIILLLDVPFPALRERLKNDTSRPLLQRPDRDEAMYSLFLERMPKYKAAAHMVIPAGAPANFVAREILHRLELE